MFRKTSYLVILISLMTVFIGVTFSVQGHSPDGNENNIDWEEVNKTVSIEATEEDKQLALETWTREARVNAQPMPFPTGLPADMERNGQSVDEFEFTGEPGFAPSGAPDPEANHVAQQEFPLDWDLINELVTEESPDATAGGAGVYTSYLGNYYSQMHQYFPYKAVGKLYISGGGYCSAAVISPNNIIATAAHCVYDTETNEWLDGWTFVPADRNGSAPYGTFPWESARVLWRYIDAPNWSSGIRSDVALITLGNNSAGHSVTYYTGNLGRTWNNSYRQNLHAIGYPSNLNDGKYTYVCTAESFWKGADKIGMGCNMEQGSSGGPWIKKFTPHAGGANNYVNAVVSGGPPCVSTGSFCGPRFSSWNIVPLCNNEGC